MRNLKVLMATFALSVSLSSPVMAETLEAGSAEPTIYSAQTETRQGHVKCIYLNDDQYGGPVDVRPEGCEFYDDEKEQMVYMTYKEFAAYEGGYSLDEITIIDVQFYLSDTYITDAALVLYEVTTSKQRKKIY